MAPGSRVTSSAGSDDGVDNSVGSNTPDDVPLVIGKPKRAVRPADESEWIVQRGGERRPSVAGGSCGPIAGEWCQRRRPALVRDKQASDEAKEEKRVHGIVGDGTEPRRFHSNRKDDPVETGLGFGSGSFSR